MLGKLLVQKQNKLNICCSSIFTLALTFKNDAVLASTFQGIINDISPTVGNVSDINPSGRLCASYWAVLFYQ